MGFIDTLQRIKTKLQERAVELGRIEVSESKLPVYPGWFYTARLGQPRGINVSEIRTFAKSTWAQMVQNTIKKAVTRTEWRIVLEDEDSEEDISIYDDDVKKIKEFFKNVNTNYEDVNDVITASMTDLLEIDAAVMVKVFSKDSYIPGVVQVNDLEGNPIEQRPEMVLKPYGQRKLIQLWEADGSTFLKNPDVYKRMQGYYQYSFKHPAASPRWFSNEEICFIDMNKRTDSVYGFSPIQSAQQVIELMIQSTRYNKDFFKNNAIPDGLVNMKGASTETVKKLKEDWRKNFKGRPHKMGFVNAESVELITFANKLKDMEWLEGQKWYFHLIFGVFGLSPAEAGFYENSNRSTQEGQERVSGKNAIQPFLDKFERKINREIIPEILQKPDIKVKMKYFFVDQGEEQAKLNQRMQELDRGVITVNEYRTEQGKEPVEWGDTPGQGPDEQFGQNPNAESPFGNREEAEGKDDKEKKDDKKDNSTEDNNKIFRKKFEVFLNDSKQAAYSN